MAKKTPNPFLLLNEDITGITLPKSTRKDNAGLKMLSRMLMSQLPARNVTPEKPSTQKYEAPGYEMGNK